MKEPGDDDNDDDDNYDESDEIEATISKTTVRTIIIIHLCNFLVPNFCLFVLVFFLSARNTLYLAEQGIMESGPQDFRSKYSHACLHWKSSVTGQLYNLT